MVRVPYLRARLIAATILSIAIAAPAAAQSGLYTWDFEDGTLQGWMPTGTAFANQPTFGNNVAVRRPGESPGQDGDWWIGSYENHRNNAVPPGPVQGDGPQGSLVSPSFRIGGNGISFLIGGGNDRNAEFVGLLIKSRPGLPPPPRPDLVYGMPDGAYQLTLVATGRNDEHMMRTIWDVHQFAGETARIIAVDQSSAPWGHLNFDSVNLPWQPPLGRAVPVGASGLGTAVPVTPGQLPPVYVPPAGSGGAPSGAVVVSPPAPGGGVMTATDPGGPTMAPAAPRYRLVASSFHVDHQTVDDMLERDGVGDEIFVRADIYAFANHGQFTGHRLVRSAVYGAHGDIRAGNGAPQFGAADDQHGGLVTNDSYPPRGDNFSATPAARTDDLPMVLWEGSLGPSDEVLIIPSIWEWDSSERSRAENFWSNQLDVQVPALRLGAPRAVEVSPLATGDAVSSDLVTPIFVYDDGNRPIGALPRDPSSRARMPVTSILLTQATAERLAHSARMFGARVDNGDGTATSVEYPGPEGGFAISWADPPQFEGIYTLYLRLERLP